MTPGILVMFAPLGVFVLWCALGITGLAVLFYLIARVLRRRSGNV